MAYKFNVASLCLDPDTAPITLQDSTTYLQNGEGILKNHIWYPNLLDTIKTQQIFTDVEHQVLWFARILKKEDNWRMYAVNQRRGRCYWNHKVITIPSWVIDSPIVGMKAWYISHELAHAYDLQKSNHDDSFMSALKDICPKNHIHHELGYKPQAAKRNGISFAVNLLELP